MVENIEFFLSVRFVLYGTRGPEAMNRLVKHLVVNQCLNLSGGDGKVA